MKTFIQIGVWNGNDEFNKLVKQENPDLVILVEPNSEMNEQIEKNYSDVNSKVHLENTAISTVSGPAKVVLSKKYFESLNGYLNSSLYTLLPMDEWGDDFDVINVDALSFEDLCKKYSIEEVDYLCIDTEGFDSQIILSIDFDKIKIKKLQYEIWGFTPEYYASYGKDAEKYGTNGMKLVEEKLTSLGYELSTVPLGTDIQAILK